MDHVTNVGVSTIFLRDFVKEPEGYSIPKESVGKLSCSMSVIVLFKPTLRAKCSLVPHACMSNFYLEREEVKLLPCNC